jgi:hypothetical protein
MSWTKVSPLNGKIDHVPPQLLTCVQQRIRTRLFGPRKSLPTVLRSCIMDLAYRLMRLFLIPPALTTHFRSRDHIQSLIILCLGALLCSRAA